MTAPLVVYDLYIPERGTRPFRAILDRPERLYVAWHRHARGICELLDGDGNATWGKPQDDLWEVRVYERTICRETAAYYELVAIRNDLDRPMERTTR